MAAQGWTAEESTAWRTFVEMHHRLERHLNRHLQRDHGISGADFEILVNVSESAQGSIAVADLAEAIVWEKSRLSHQLRRMADRGLLRRDTTDRRRHTVTLTEAGWAVIRAAAPANARRVREFFIDVLGPERLTTMRHLSGAILDAVNSRSTESSIERA